MGSLRFQIVIACCFAIFIVVHAFQLAHSFPNPFTNCKKLIAHKDKALPLCRKSFKNSDNLCMSKNGLDNVEASAAPTDFITLGKLKRVTVSAYKGKVQVDIRRYYVDEASGEERPTPKGVNMSLEEWNVLKQSMADIDDKIAAITSTLKSSKSVGGEVQCDCC